VYDHDRKNHDQDRTRTHALEAGERRQGYVIAPYSISLTSFMRAPDYPIPSGFTDYKLSPLQAEIAAKRRAERAQSGRRGPDVVVVLLPANLVPGAVTVTQFMSRPDIPLPASFESAEDRAAYGRPRVSEPARPERPEDRAIRELLDEELASWAEEQAAEVAALEARGLTVRAPAARRHLATRRPPRRRRTPMRVSRRGARRTRSRAQRRSAMLRQTRKGRMVAMEGWMVRALVCARRAA